VRRKPRPEAIAVVSKIYRQMVQVELNAGSKDACDASLSLLNNVLVSKGMDYEAFVLSI
jgi:hypothetical protein